VNVLRANHLSAIVSVNNIGTLDSAMSLEEIYSVIVYLHHLWCRYTCSCTVNEMFSVQLTMHDKFTDMMHHEASLKSSSVLF
jgi:coproporphyrinogen III oxidase-like Fe-S oxidoreductase